MMEADKEEDRKLVQTQIPEVYHKYWEVFSERALYRYPPKWEEDLLKHNKYVGILSIAVTTLQYITISMITIFSMYIAHVR